MEYFMEYDNKREKNCITPIKINERNKAIEKI